MALFSTTGDEQDIKDEEVLAGYDAAVEKGRVLI